MQVKVKMKSTEDDAEWIWDRNKFVNRTYLMKEIFQNYFEGDEDWDVPEVCETPLTIHTYIHKLYFSLD